LRGRRRVSPSVQDYSIVSLKGSKGYFRKLSPRASIEIQSFNTKPKNGVEILDLAAPQIRRQQQNGEEVAIKP
jgi:hypothetical protein